jgi:hypothetical protein
MSLQQQDHTTTHPYTWQQSTDTQVNVSLVFSLYCGNFVNPTHPTKPHQDACTTTHLCNAWGHLPNVQLLLLESGADVGCRCHGSSRTPQQHTPTPGSNQRTHRWVGLHPCRASRCSVSTVGVWALQQLQIRSRTNLASCHCSIIMTSTVRASTQCVLYVLCATGVLTALLGCGRCNIWVKNKSPKLPLEVYHKANTRCVLDVLVLL